MNEKLLDIFWLNVIVWHTYVGTHLLPIHCVLPLCIIKLLFTHVYMPEKKRHFTVWIKGFNPKKCCHLNSFVAKSSLVFMIDFTRKVGNWFLRDCFDYLVNNFFLHLLLKKTKLLKNIRPCRCNKFKSNCSNILFFPFR